MNFKKSKIISFKKFELIIFDKSEVTMQQLEQFHKVGCEINIEQDKVYVLKPKNNLFEVEK